MNMFIRNRSNGADQWQDWWDQNKSAYLSEDDLGVAVWWFELAKTDPIESAGRRHEMTHEPTESPIEVETKQIAPGHAAARRP